LGSRATCIGFEARDLGMAFEFPGVEGLGEETFGEAKVLQPIVNGSTINQYITYLVQVTLGGESYSSRKRYSDFEWLRNALTSCFPGVRVPPLPKKHSTAQGLLAKTGMSQEAFIETRRAGLEDFLKRCLQRKELCVDSKILRGFLGTTSEEATEEFKRKIDGVSISGKSQKYSQIFEALKEASLPTEDRISPCKEFLRDQVQQLRELSDGYKAIVDAQEAVTKALAGAQTKLSALSYSESTIIERAGFAKDSRIELIEGLRQQSKVMQASPAMHYDLLLEAAERELLEAEAMTEALESVELLETDSQEAREKAQSMGTTLKKVMDGGDIPSTGTGVARMLGIAAPKDREERIAEMKADHEKKQKDATAMEEWYELARRVLICREMESFFREKVTGHKQAKNAFAGLSQSTAERMVGIWGGGGPVATALDPLEAAVEYE